jgi:hypothetical protein
MAIIDLTAEQRAPDQKSSAFDGDVGHVMKLEQRTSSNARAGVIDSWQLAEAEASKVRLEAALIRLNRHCRRFRSKIRQNLMVSHEQSKRKAGHAGKADVGPAA